MVPELKYDSTVNRATLVTHDDGWYLWAYRPDAAPAELHFASRNEVGDAILDSRLSDQNAVIQHFKRQLINLGYSVTSAAGPLQEEFIADWELAPGQN
jgi:hypothetical protein